MPSAHETKSALIAAQNALEDAIRRQVEMENQHRESVAEIVHDIKNPLTAMIGLLSLIKNEAVGPIGNETYKGFIKTIDSSAGRLLTICNSLLEEYADYEPEMAPEKRVNVTDLVGEIGDLFQAKAKEREITLSTVTPDAIPELQADPQELFRVMTNLVSNAIKFTPKGGKIDVQAELDPKDNTYIMVVRDSGVGMTREQIARVFSHKTSTVSPHGDLGTGQGLGIVNRIVQSYGGKLDIVSTENRGTRIKLKFPKSVSLT